MERHQLEDRIRASLQARADDVQPTPELWEQVSHRTTRRARWQLAAWAMSGVAAVAALVVGGLVLLGSPRGVEIAPEPDVVDSPTGGPTTTDAAPGDGGGAPTIVTTDGTSLFRLDPATGEVVQAYTPRTDVELEVAIREVAVRPDDGSGRLTVATVIENEGTYDAEVYVFDASGARLERRTLGMGATATDLPPDLVWSQDGRFVMWAGPSGHQAPAGPALWAYDWADRPAGLLADDPFTATAPGTPPALFDGTGVVDLREWTGDPMGRSTIVATTTTGPAFLLEMVGGTSNCGESTEDCLPIWQPTITPLEFEGGSVVDRARLASGVDLALVTRSGESGDTGGATLELLAGPMSDQQRSLQIPQLTTGTAAPLDGWLAAAGDRVAIGFGPEGHLLTVSGGTTEGVEVTSTVALPEGTVAAGMAPAVTDQASPAPTELRSATPTEAPPEDPGTAVLEDGLPAHVVTNPQRARLQLVDRRDPEQALATWPRPEGLDPQMFPAEVVVHPDGTPSDLQLVTRWTVGEASVLVRTVVRNGEVLVNEALPADLQPTNAGGAGVIAEPSPVFSPSGDWLAWVETPDGDAGPARVRLVGWGTDGPTGVSRTEPAPADVSRPSALVDWARTADGDVLTMVPAPDLGQGVGTPPAMVELRLQVTSSLIAQTTAADWRTVDLPGILFEAGSFVHDDGTERYIAFDGGDDVLYGMAEAPGSAVPTGAAPFSEGRVVAFGPGSALVQRADGAWQRVQVDDGATSAVDVPDATVAVLPWPG